MSKVPQSGKSPDIEMKSVCGEFSEVLLNRVPPARVDDDNKLDQRSVNSVYCRSRLDEWTDETIEKNFKQRKEELSAEKAGLP